MHRKMGMHAARLASHFLSAFRILVRPHRRGRRVLFPRCSGPGHFIFGGLRYPVGHSLQKTL